MPKPRIHRYRRDCEMDMLKVVMRHISEAEPTSCIPNYDTWRDMDSDKPPNSYTYTYLRAGAKIEITITWPESCTVCGNTQRRLDMKYGRNW
jgi:hypothetical protein